LQKPGFTTQDFALTLHTCQSSQSTSEVHLPSSGTHLFDSMLHICHASQSNCELQPPGFGTHTCLLWLQISAEVSQKESLSQ
jgi:hypothetical protein